MDRVNGARSDFSGQAGVRAASAVEAIAVAAREIQLVACVRAVLVSAQPCAPRRRRRARQGRRWPCSCWARAARRRTCTSLSPRAPPALRPASAASEPNNTGPINNNIPHLRVRHQHREIFQCSLSNLIKATLLCDRLIVFSNMPNLF